MDNSKYILIIEDEKMISDVIKSYLEKEGYRVRCEQDGKEGLKTFLKTKPDFLILDLMLPGMSGEEICKTVRSNSRTPIIMLTAKSEEDEVLEGLDIGADDYVTKPFSVKELVGRVKAVLRRSSNEPEPLFNKVTFNNGELEINLSNNEVKKQGESVKLTPNEYRILITLLKFPNKTFTREELIEIAFGQEYEGYTRTIDTHIKNLRQKLEEDIKNPKYIITMHGFGYRFGGNLNEI